MITNDLLDTIRGLKLAGTDTEEIKSQLMSQYSESDIDQALFELENTQSEYEPLEFSDDTPKKVGFYPFVLIAIGVLALSDAITEMFNCTDDWGGLAVFLLAITIMPVLSLINLLLLRSKKYNETAKFLLIAGVILHIFTFIVVMINDGPSSVSC